MGNTDMLRMMSYCPPYVVGPPILARGSLWLLFVLRGKGAGWEGGGGWKMRRRVLTPPSRTLCIVSLSFCLLGYFVRGEKERKENWKQEKDR